MAKPTHQKRSLGSLAQEHLKQCPLCDALNSKNNPECFVCGWSGTFQVDALVLENSLKKLIESCPDLQVQPSKLELFKKRVLSLWYRKFGSRIDIRA